jgi:hypothetical protein
MEASLLRLPREDTGAPGQKHPINGPQGPRVTNHYDISEPRKPMEVERQHIALASNPGRHVWSL